jgi:hypothetical protein
MIDQQNLLDDEGMRDFITNGYVTVHPDLPHVHEEIYRETAAIFEREGDPRNQILQRVPQLYEVFAHPAIRGVLTSLLGPDYVLHPHRHAHIKRPGQEGGRWHQDGRSGNFTTKDHGWLFEWRRHHRIRSVWVWYYPQEVTRDMGPTAVIPGVQYYDMESMRYYDNAYSEPEIVASLCGPAGTVTIGHYHSWHSSWGTNHSNKNRYMIKFLFSRSREPQRPSWNSTGAAPVNEATEQDAIRGLVAARQHVWDWLGGQSVGQTKNGNGTTADIARSIDALRDPEASVRLGAAYSLGTAGESAVGPLIDSLRHAPEPGKTSDEPIRLNAANALSAIGSPAVPALISLLNDDSPWWVRATAADTLGDVGEPSTDAVPALIRALDDESEWVRRNSVNAVGTIGAGGDALIMALRDAHPLVRCAAVSALVRMCSGAEQGAPGMGNGTDAAVRGLAEVMYEDEYAIVREYAVTALEQISHPTSIDFLEEHGT